MDLGFGPDCCFVDRRWSDDLLVHENITVFRENGSS